MDKIKSKIQDFKNPQGQTGDKALMQEGKTAEQNYKKDQGNNAQFGKDEMAAFKGSSDTTLSRYLKRTPVGASGDCNLSLDFAVKYEERWDQTVHDIE